MKQHGGAIPFEELAKAQRRNRRKNRKHRKNRKNRQNTKKSSRKGHRRTIRKTNRYKKKRSNRTRVPKRTTSKRRNSRKKTLNKGSLLKYKNKCKCNVTQGDNMNNPNALGYCANCIPEGVMLKGKDGKIYRNKKKEWIKID